MKQFDYESSSYKHKEDIKALVQSFNDLADKYVKSYEGRSQEIKKINSNIDKKNAQIQKLEVSLADLEKKTTELKSLKDLSNSEISELNAKKSEISYTDSEVQKMELDDINAQIAAKKAKVSKVDGKLDATKAKIKTSTDEKKTAEKELKDLEKDRILEEETIYRTDALMQLVKETKESFSAGVLDIINKPYKVDAPQEETVSLSEPVVEDAPMIEPEIVEEEVVMPEPEVIDDYHSTISLEEINFEPEEMVIPETPNFDAPLVEPEMVLEPIVEEPKVEEQPKEEKKENKKKETAQGELENKFKAEGIDFDAFNNTVKEKLRSNEEVVLKNLEILNNHKIPLEYTLDQPEIFYDISNQDLDDLLSIITTDDEGNGMGFTIDFTYNILTELSKINVDRLIDVYNSEFMNVNAKSGIIHLLKLTNPGLVDFEKNRRANIELLKSLGTQTVDEIVSKYPEFVNMDNPLFINILNVFDKSDLVDKLNSDIDVVPKIIDYWKNN